MSEPLSKRLKDNEKNDDQDGVGEGGEAVTEISSVQSPTPSSKVKPTVVRIARRGGKIIQDCDIYIGRACTYGGWNLPRSKWANPFSVKEAGSALAAVERYRRHILTKSSLLKQLSELEGKTLGCWCKPGPCHGDVLVALFEERFL